jgi:phage FluMu gp28-like protein
LATVTTALEYTRPWVYEKQRIAIFDPLDLNGNPARYSLIEASTKTGKTVGCIVWLAELAMAGLPGWNYWWVAPTFAVAKIAYRRLKRGLPQQVYSANDSNLFIRLANGAVIWFKGADKPDSLYGEDVHAAVIDEASRVKEDAWYAVRSTLTATEGPVRIIGNVKGRTNWFYQLARRAESGEQGMSYHKLLAYDAVQAGVLSAKEVEDARRTLPEQVFRELYLAEPSDDGGNPFGLKAIRDCVSALSDGPPACWGWDLAKSHDWTVGIALDAHGRTCRFERFQKPWLETIQHIAMVTGDIPALVDSTGVGDPVLEALQKQGQRFEGFKFSSHSKQQLMEGLAVAIQQREITYPDGIITMELEQFAYEYTRTGVRYSAPAGLHDDCVCSLALAVSKFRVPVARPSIRSL